MRWTEFVGVGLVAALGSVGTGAPPSRGEPAGVEVWKTDGSEVAAQGVVIDERGAVTLALGEAGVASCRLDELVAVRFRPPRGAAARPAAEPRTGSGPLVVWLHDGSRLAGRLLGGGEESLELEFCGRPLALPIDTIRAVFAGPRAELLEPARFAAPADGDALFRRATAGGDSTRGTLAAFKPAGISFEYALGTGDFGWEELEAVVLAPQVELAAPAPPLVVAELGTLGRLRGTLERLGPDGAVVRPAGFERALEVPLAELGMLRVPGTRVRWLSEAVPARVEQQPYFGPASAFLYPDRVDRTVTGRPLAVGGVTFATGFGCHARTLLEFAHDGGAAELRASVGVADEVLALGDRGAIEFRVLLDGTEAWKSAPRRGGDPPLPVPALSLAGVRRIALVTDFGPGEDVADRGVWGDPRIVVR